MELVKMQYGMEAKGRKLVLLFEGRDAAGKDGLVECLTEPLDPHGYRLVALGKPSDTERPQWYFQRTSPTCPPPGRSSCPTAVRTTGQHGTRHGLLHAGGVRRVPAPCPEFEQWWSAPASFC